MRKELSKLMVLDDFLQYLLVRDAEAGALLLCHFALPGGICNGNEIVMKAVMLDFVQISL